MTLRRRWDINTRTQLIALGPALLLTVLLISFFTFVRIQDLRQELRLGAVGLFRFLPGLDQLLHGLVLFAAGLLEPVGQVIDVPR